MKSRDYKNTLDKISCTESFRKNMEKQLSAPPEEVYSDSDDSFERSSGRSFGKYAAMAAAFVLIASAGALLYRIKNMPPDDIYPGTEFTEPTSEPTEEPTNGTTYAPEKLIPGSSLTNVDPSWKEAVYVPAAPANEDKAVTFNMTDVQAVLDAVSECRFVWSNESRFSDPRMEEFMVGSLEIYTDGYIQQAFSSDSRLMRVAEGDWDKVVNILREQLHADENVAEELQALEAGLNTDGKAMEDAAKSNPDKGEVSGLEVAKKALDGESTNAVFIGYGSIQGGSAVRFTVDDLPELKEAVQKCSFVWDNTDTDYQPDSEYYKIGSLNIYPEGYIMDTSSPKLMKVTFGDWDKVMNILTSCISKDASAVAELAIIKPEKQYYTMSAGISVDLSIDPMTLFNITGSGKMLYRDNSAVDSVLFDDEYIYINDPDTGYTGELVTTILDDDWAHQDCQFDYTEHTSANRINKLSSNWDVHQDKTGFTAHTNGSRFYNPPTLEYKNICCHICQTLGNIYGGYNSDISTEAVWEGDILSYSASYNDSVGKRNEVKLKIDRYGTPLLYTIYVGSQRTLYYELTDVVYNSEIEMPQPVLNRFE